MTIKWKKENSTKKKGGRGFSKSNTSKDINAKKSRSRKEESDFSEDKRSTRKPSERSFDKPKRNDDSRSGGRSSFGSERRKSRDEDNFLEDYSPRSDKRSTRKPSERSFDKPKRNDDSRSGGRSSFSSDRRKSRDEDNFLEDYSPRSDKRSTRKPSERSFDKPKRSDDSRSGGRSSFGSDRRKSRDEDNFLEDYSPRSDKRSTRKPSERSFDKPERSDDSRSGGRSSFSSERRKSRDEDNFLEDYSPRSDKRSTRKPSERSFDKPKRNDDFRSKPRERKVVEKRSKPVIENNNFTAAKQDSDGSEERIAKYIASCGVCSRRDAEILIEEGKVFCNGEKVSHPSLKVSDNDAIKVNGKLIQRKSDSGIWIFNKPKGYITTTKDPEGRKTIFDLIPGHLPRLITVGRLDINSEGLLLLTNDAKIAHYLEQPTNNISRLYKVRVFGQFKESYIEKLANGVTVDGMKYKPINVDILSQTPNNTWVLMTLHEGKNREIRNIMEHFNLKVARLIRLEYGNFSLGDIPLGKLFKVADVVTENLLEKINEDNSR